MTTSTVPTTESLQQQFLEWLPRITHAAQQMARSLRCHHDREDAIADVVAHAWEHFVHNRQRITLDTLLEQIRG